MTGRRCPLKRFFSGTRILGQVAKHPKNRSIDARPRGFRLAVLAGVLASLAISLAAPSPGRAGAPLRSGTIVGGVGETPVSPWVRGMEGCVGAPSCSAWLQSGCSPLLSSGDAAVQAAVVDVRDLADNRERTLSLTPHIVIFGARYTVQFWTNSDDPLSGGWCGEILGLRFSVVAGPYARSSLRVPPEARWMTITSSPENLKTTWRLT